MPDYQQGKIYKLVCNTTGLVYVGSTTEKRLCSRLSGHVGHFKNYEKGGNSKYCSSFEIIKNGNYEIILLENFPCNNSDELHQKERFYKENNDCVNRNNPIRTTQDKKIHNKKFIEDNREYVRKWHSENYLRNKEHIDIKNKQWQEENKDRRNEYVREWRVKNNDKVKEQRQKDKEKLRIKTLYLDQLKYYNI